MATVKILLEDAHSSVESALSLLLDRCSLEIFDINDQLSELVELIDSDSNATRGIYAVSFFLAGVAINIAKTTTQVTKYAEKKPRTNKLLKCQEMIATFADRLDKECYNHLSQVANQLMVLKDHPDVTYDMHTRLTFQLERVEELEEKIYDIAEQLKNHPILKINLNLIHGGLK